jgi:hypothetical protein
MRMTCWLLLLALVLEPGAAFTCPAGCACGNSSTLCSAWAIGDGGGVNTCADCGARSLAAVPSLSSDTTCLYLSGNPGLASAIAAEGFPSAASWTSLTSLRLADIGIPSLPPGVFSALAARLVTLDLGGNRIANLPSAVFSGMNALATLSLGGAVSIAESLHPYASSHSSTTTLTLGSSAPCSSCMTCSFSASSAVQGCCDFVEIFASSALTAPVLWSSTSSAIAGARVTLLPDPAYLRFTSDASTVDWGYRLFCTRSMQCSSQGNTFTSLPSEVFAAQSGLSTLVMQCLPIQTLPANTLAPLTALNDASTFAW